MEDAVPATIAGQEQVRLAGDEYIVPADVVADLGDGSSEHGSRVLDAMVGRIRMAKHGGTEQPPPIDPAAVLPA